MKTTMTIIIENANVAKDLVIPRNQVIIAVGLSIYDVAALPDSIQIEIREDGTDDWRKSYIIISTNAAAGVVGTISYPNIPYNTFYFCWNPYVVLRNPKLHVKATITPNVAFYGILTITVDDNI